MPEVSGAKTIARRGRALFALFLVQGIALAAWVTRTPAIRDLLDASTAEMGFVLLGLAVGSMSGILSSARLVARFGARKVIAASTLGVIVSMPVIGTGAELGSQLVAAAGLFLFGAGMGSGEIAINIEGAEVERVTGQPFLHAMHGCFSLGTVCGAVIGIVATGTGFPVGWHLAAVGAVALCAFLWALGGIPEGTGRAQPKRPSGGAARLRPAVWKDSRLLFIGGIVLAMAFVEGTANDWLPLVMVDGHGFDAALGSAVFALFAASMTAGRFAGGMVLRRFSRSRVLATSAMCAALGLALVAYVDNQVVAALAVVIWGLGASLGFPVALSAAADSGEEPAARVALVAMLGYAAFLVGPPLLGMVGEAVGLRNALIIPLVVVVCAAFFARAARHASEG